MSNHYGLLSSKWLMAVLSVLNSNFEPFSLGHIQAVFLLVPFGPVNALSTRAVKAPRPGVLRFSRWKTIDSAVAVGAGETGPQLWLSKAVLEDAITHCS